MANEILVISPELKKLIDSVPVELLRRGPERYDSLRPSARGSWKTVLYDGLPIAVAWTDWKEGFGIINLKTEEPTDRLENYVITAKALDIPAGWAYTSLETVVSKYEFDREVTLSGQTDGKLSKLTQDEETEVDTEEDDDDTE